MPALNATDDAFSQLGSVSFDILMSSTRPALRTRTLYDIVRSCLLTIFACTWTSLHPNIFPCATVVQGFIYRLHLMVIAVVIPEATIIWATRQWTSARELAQEYQDFGWTTTHGYFAIMGGFLFKFNRDDPDNMGVIASPYAEPLESLIKSRKIQADVSREDIEDKSKSDILSKSLVLLQLFWFISQFIGRLYHHLPVTKLELMTLAYVILNFAIYFFWWNKPQNLNRPIRIYSDMLESSKFTASRKPEKEQYMPSVDSCESGSGFQVASESLRPLPHEIVRNQQTFQGNLLFHLLRGMTSNEFKRECANGFFTNACQWYPGSPQNGGDLRAAPCGILLASVFGAIHLAGWHFSFPTWQEQTLWRVCSIIVTAVPLGPSLVALFVAVIGVMPGNPEALEGGGPLLFLGLSILAYVVARLVLLVEVFLLLRDMPPGVFQTISWADYLVHFY